MEIKYKDLLDYIVAYLYEMQINNKTGYFSLKKIVEQFQYNTDFENIIDIAKYLEARDRISANYIFGDVLIKISTTGIIYIEDKGKLFNRKFRSILADLEFEENIEKIAKELGEKTNSNESVNIEKYFNQIRRKIEKSNDWNKDAYLNKLEIVRLLLKEMEPPKPIIMKYIDELYEVPHISSLLKDLELMIFHK